MMLIKELYEKLISSEIFKEWKKGHEDSYLSGCYNARDGVNDNFWNFDFYNSNDTITTFQTGDKIEKNEDQKIFKEHETKLNEVNLEDIEIDLDKAIQLVKKPSGENFTKTIAILQKTDEPVWNITMISKSFNVLNTKISAVTGRKVSSNFGSVLEFRKVVN